MYKIHKIKTRADGKDDVKVLVLYTGGTFGMRFDNKMGTLVPFDFGQIPENLPEISRLDAEITFVIMDELLDSANVKPQHWLKYAAIIDKYYKKYDAFVVLHGTDTMAYTASALSFLLQNIDKPIILTGAQLPIGVARTDAKENLLTALEIASQKTDNQSIVNEVCVYFNAQLLRGNRARKHESQQFNAFVSENYPSLATVGINLQYNHPFMWKNTTNKSYKFYQNLDENIAVLKFFPGISQNFVTAVLNTLGLKGLVLETFGSGTAPTDLWLLNLLQKKIEAGLLVLNISQCIGGRVDKDAYATSQSLSKIGVISGADMTIEAASTKLMFVLGLNLQYNESKLLLEQNLVGELTD